jgi:hypothetical protein
MAETVTSLFGGHKHRARHGSREKIWNPAQRSGNQQENETSRDLQHLGLTGNITSTIRRDYAVDERPLKRPARISRCHPRSSRPPFKPVSEIIAELQAVATWSGEHRNSPRPAINKRQSCKCRNRIIHSRAFRSVSGCEIAIEGVVDA